MRLDRIDHSILKLLQQRTKLSRHIGEIKQRHGAMIYVPERERELLRRVVELGGEALPPRSVAAIYREILSGSRAAQGQGAIGLLHSSASAVSLPARWCFGACGDLVPMKTWTDLAGALSRGKLALVLLTGGDLGRILAAPKSRRMFLKDFLVVSDLAPRIDQDCPIQERIFILISRAEIPDSKTNRILVLIECKSNADTVKSWLNSMQAHSIHAEKLHLAGRGGSSVLVRLSAHQAIPADTTLHPLRSGGVSCPVLGIYGGAEDYGG